LYQNNNILLYLFPFAIQQSTDRTPSSTTQVMDVELGSSQDLDGLIAAIDNMEDFPSSINNSSANSEDNSFLNSCKNLLSTFHPASLFTPAICMGLDELKNEETKEALNYITSSKPNNVYTPLKLEELISNSHYNAIITLNKYFENMKNNSKVEKNKRNSRFSSPFYSSLLHPIDGERLDPMMLLDFTSPWKRKRTKEQMTKKVTQFIKQWKDAITIQESPFSIMNASFEYVPPVWESSSFSATFREYITSSTRSTCTLDDEWGLTLWHEP